MTTRSRMVKIIHLREAFLSINLIKLSQVEVFQNLKICLTRAFVELKLLLRICDNSSQVARLMRSTIKVLKRLKLVMVIVSNKNLIKFNKNSLTNTKERIIHTNLQHKLIKGTMCSVKWTKEERLVLKVHLIKLIKQKVFLIHLIMIVIKKSIAFYSDNYQDNQLSIEVI